MILGCDCKHTQQDEIHGSQQRVMNALGGKNKEGIHRCTVCGRERLGTDHARQSTIAKAGKR